MSGRPSIGTGTSLYANDWTSPDFGNNISMTFDSTSLGSNQSAIFSCTFKASTISNITWSNQDSGLYLSPTTFDSTFSTWAPWIVNFANASGASCDMSPSLIRRASDNRVGIIWNYGTFSTIYFGTGLDWDTAIADKFVSLVVCHAPTSASFANWTGPTVGASQDAVRAVLVTASTGVIIGTVDAAATIFNAIVADPSAVTWRPYWQTTLAAGDFNSQTFTLSDTGGEANRDYLFLNSGWASIGDILDPTATDTTTGLPYYTLLSGQGMPGTVGGKQAWINFYSAGTYTSGTDDGLYRLSSGRTGQSTGTYSLMPTSYHTSPLTDSAHP
jgi:hypothetical protein